MPTVSTCLQQNNQSRPNHITALMALTPMQQLQHLLELGYLEKFNNGASELKTPDRLVHVVQANAINSPLLRLPSEIHNAIYAYALQPRSGSDRIHVTRRLCAASRDKMAVHLLRVSRQIYSKAATIVYTSKFSVHHLNSASLWLDRLNKRQREAIVEIHELWQWGSNGDKHIENLKATMGYKVPQLEWSWRPRFDEETGRVDIECHRITLKRRTDRE
ncbi:hypothetical protein K491DRAFT_772669 [Lophiostoma macrostomum CBS 122681]|uniref:F-box domain-containing protein n=1 Tax=Lophiostoma macrostomum CBS 122681 TaxID=1314788 RepID=A0A6A6TVW4_9PLEO|nr:hypothetical protein K491DRAFT_772669 [Lophiostoma macrostomum CBS 122681]